LFAQVESGLSEPQGSSLSTHGVLPHVIRAPPEHRPGCRPQRPLDSHTTVTQSRPRDSYGDAHCELDAACSLLPQLTLWGYLTASCNHTNITLHAALRPNTLTWALPARTSAPRGVISFFRGATCPSSNPPRLRQTRRSEADVSGCQTLCVHHCDQVSGNCVQTNTARSLSSAPRRTVSASRWLRGRQRTLLAL